VARFLARAGEPLQFELVGHRDLVQAGSVAVNQIAPAWHPRHPRETPVGVLEHLPGFRLTAADPEASAILLGLYDGYDTELRHHAFFGPPGTLWLRIGAMRMRPAYREFMACWQGGGGVGWAELARSRVQFDWDEDALLLEARQRLQTIARYVAADPGISRVYIDGHTDATGSDGYNRALSQRRAQAVAALLRAEGVAPDLLVVRYHGARYPVADNATDTGRADNRRTTVRLERERQALARN
jgi:outer membrane protein OmpA-like peptidoglycan-associated protein